MLHLEKKILPINDLQQELILTSKSTITNSLKNVHSIIFDLKGDLNIEHLKKALVILTQHHESLRCHLQNEENKYFIIDNIPNESTEWPLIKFNNNQKILQSSNHNHASNEIITKILTQHPINPEQGPLWRAALSQIKEKHYYLFLMFHSTIIDNHSINIFLRNLSKTYNELQEKNSSNPLPIKSLSLTLPGFSLKKKIQNNKLSIDDFKTTTNPENKHSTSFEIPNHLCKLLSNQLLLQESNFSYLVTSCLFFILCQYLDEKTFPIGAILDNRNNLDEQIFFFWQKKISDLKLEYNKFFYELYSSIKEQFDPSNKPFTHLQEQKSTELNPSILIQPNNINPNVFLSGIKSTLIEQKNNYSGFSHIAINVAKNSNNKLICSLDYNNKKFTSNEIETIWQRVIHLLNIVALNPKISLNEISLLLPNEKHKIVKINDNDAQPINNQTINQVLESTAKLQPNKIAIYFHQKNGSLQTITYQELYEKSCLLANYFESKNINHGSVVGVALPRSIELFIVLFALWKQKAVFLPIDLNCTTTNNLKLKMAKAHTLIFNSNNQTTPLQNFDGNYIDIQTILNKICSSKTEIDLNNSVSKNIKQHNQIQKNHHPAYIMFTSGTTSSLSKPKGVYITHEGLNNLYHALLDEKIHENCQVLSTAQPTFDAILYDLLVVLARHGSLHLPNDECRFLPDFIEKIVNKYQITYMVTLPVLLDKISPTLPLKHIITMGAAPHSSTLQKIKEKNPNIRIENGYGLTETTICLTLSPWENGECEGVIGKPIRNMKLYILNPETLSLCPFNTPGEIYISGPGVTPSGYIDQPELNNIKFINGYFDNENNRFIRQNGTQNESTITLYASGDKACYTLNKHNEATIQFLGRTDRKVKIKGEQIELEVIEQLLKKCTVIKDAVVLPDQTKEFLIAYIIPQTPFEAFNKINKKIRLWLGKTNLPKPCYPSTIVITDKFPITQNGKVDYKKLQQIPHTNNTAWKLNQLKQLTPTPNNLQDRLILIWSIGLNCTIEEIDINASYEELGGDSLSYITLMPYLKKYINPNSNFEFISPSTTIKQLINNMTKLPKLVPIESSSQYLAPVSIIEDTITTNQASNSSITNKK